MTRGATEQGIVAEIAEGEEQLSLALGGLHRSALGKLGFSLAAKTPLLFIEPLSLGHLAPCRRMVDVFWAGATAVRAAGSGRKRA